MNSVLLIAGVVVVTVVLFAVFRIQKVKYQNKKQNALRFERIKPLYDRLESGQPVPATEVIPYAENLLTREGTFHLLQSRDKLGLFPPEYLTIIKGAESHLANWLQFPTELGACPDEIEHIKRVTFDFDGQSNFVHYEVFKYRVKEPHWAAKNGWMLGVVGPYFDDSKPYDRAMSTFSRVDSTVDKVSPEEEAKWVHENISMRR